MKIRVSQIFILAYFFICYALTAQDKGIADSLLSLYLNKEYKENDSSEFKLYFNLAYYHPNPDTCIHFADKLIEKSKKIKSNYWLYRGYLQKGNARLIKGDLDIALKAFIRSAKYAKLDDNRRGMGVVYAVLGDTYSSAKNHKNSIVYYNKSINLLRELNDSIALATVLLNTGSEYLYSNIQDTALIYFSESLEIFKLLDHNIGFAYSLGNIGKIHSDQGNLTLAEENIIIATQILEEIGDLYSLAIYQRYLADIYFNQNNSSKSITLARSSLKIALEANLMPQVRDASFLLANVYEKMGDYKNAYHYQQKHYTYRDSIINEQAIREMADMRTEFEVAQKQAEVEKAQTLLELSRKQRQTQKMVGISLIVVIALVSALAFVLFRSAKKDRAGNRLLREQKEELETQRDMLEDVNNTKDRFFSIISHDLRGPIGVLNGTTMLIREFLDSKDYSHLDELTANMEYSVKKVQSLLDNILEWALSQRGQYNYNPEKVELNHVILDAISIFSDMAFAKNIELTYEQKYADAYIFADRNSLSTILRNLISNALKFTNKKGYVSILVEKGESQTQIIIKDSGVGIPEEKLTGIFEIEAKKSTWGTAKEKGLGIGLSLVYEFVKMNSAEIEVKSTVNVGTIFTISFPLDHQIAKVSQAENI